MTLHSCVFPTPLGDMLAVASERGLCLLEFVGQAGVERELAQVEAAHACLAQARDSALLAQTRSQIAVKLDYGELPRAFYQGLGQRGQAWANFKQRLSRLRVDGPHYGLYNALVVQKVLPEAFTRNMPACFARVRGCVRFSGWQAQRAASRISI